MQDTTQRASSSRSRDLETWIKQRVNRAILTISGKGFRSYSLLTHVWRRSGRVYRTPITAFPLGDGFVFALLDRDRTKVDWCCNVLAAQTCTLTTRWRTYQLERPEMIPATSALGAYPLLWRDMLVSRGINQFLWVHRQPQRSEPVIGTANPE